MKRERIRCELQCGGYGAGGESFWACLHQKAKDIQAIFLRECGQSRHSTSIFHISMVIEM